LGARGDSYFEYLLKLWILTGKKEDQYRRMYDEQMDAVIATLVQHSTPSNYTYIAELVNGNLNHKMDHLACFAGAMFALGSYHKATARPEEHMRLGEELTRTCHEMYTKQVTGLSPDTLKFIENQDFQPDDKKYILRPEAVESYFVLYWITGDPKYQEWGWDAFNAIENHCRVASGYAGIHDVTNAFSSKDDLQYSYFLAETLKYLYLLYSPKELISLDKFVFNTEAHPMKIWST